MKFIGEGFQKLDHEQDRQTHKHAHTQTQRQTQLNALPATIAGGKYVRIFTTQLLVQVLSTTNLRFSNNLKINELKINSFEH